MTRETGKRGKMNDGSTNKDGRQDSGPSEKIYMDPEKSSKFFLALSSLRRSKEDKFKNKVAGCDGLVGDAEVVHSSS